MAKYKSRPRVRRELSNETKLAKLRQWEKEYKLNSDDINKLVEKYGPYAYDLVRYARAEPRFLLDRIGHADFLRSNATIHYLAENDLDTATLAKAIKKKEAQVEAGLAQYKIDAKQINENAEIRAIEEQANKQKRQFDRQVDSRTSPQGAEARDASEQAPEDNNQDLQQITDRDPGNMSLSDWVKNYPADKKPLRRDQLIEAAYQDFGKSEGLKSYVYQDPKNPTIGNGHLIFRKDKINNAQHIAMYRRKFQDLDLVKDGRKLTTVEKGSLYDKMVDNVRKTGSIGNPAQYGKLTQEGMKKTFKEDCLWAYNVAKKQFPQIDSYPSDLQLTLVHAYFGGYANIIDNTIKGNFADLPAKYRTKAMREFINLDKNNPKAVQKLLETMISDINGRNTANAYENQIKAVSDTLTTAERQHAEMQQRQQQQQRQKALDNNIRVVMSMSQDGNTPT